MQRKAESLSQENVFLEKHINLGYENIREDSKRTLTTIQIVLAVFAGIVALIGIIIGFGAPRYIRNKVNEKVGLEVDSKVREKVTADNIKEIIQEESKKGVEKLTKELEKKSKQIIEKAEKDLAQIAIDLKQKAIEWDDLNAKYIKGLSEVEQLKDKKKEDFTPEDKEKVKEFSETLSELKDENSYTAEDWFWKAYDEDENKQYEKAIEYLNKAIELKPDYEDAYVNRGIAYSNLQKYDEAMADYTKAIKLEPNDSGAYINRGIAYTNLQKSDDAIADFTNAINIKPDNAFAYFNRGIPYYNLKYMTQQLLITQKQLNSNRIMQMHTITADLHMRISEEI